MLLETYFSYALVGAVCTLLVGMTGCGGGSVMTPLLILCGQSPAMAVGTDLLYASASKSLYVWRYGRLGVIHWRAVKLLCLGAVPITVAATVVLHTYPITVLIQLIEHVLGVMLFVSAILMITKKKLVG